MRTQQISSFADIRAAMENFERADAALAGGVARGNSQLVRSALRAGANPLQAQDDSGEHLFLRALNHDNGEEMVAILLNQIPEVESAELSGDSLLLVHLMGGHTMAVPAHAGDTQALERLAKFLEATRVWRCNYPTRDSIDMVRLRQVNRNLSDGARAGLRDLVEKSLAEGATVLASDLDGKPALCWASEHPNHAQLVGAMFANDPSVFLEDEENDYALRNLPYARMGTGGLATYVAPEPQEMSHPSGHEVWVEKAHINDTLRAHLHTLRKLGEAMGELSVELVHRGMPAQLKWPNQVDFQRLLAEHFTQSIEETGGHLPEFRTHGLGQPPGTPPDPRNLGGTQGDALAGVGQSAQ